MNHGSFVSLWKDARITSTLCRKLITITYQISKCQFHVIKWNRSLVFISIFSSMALHHKKYNNLNCSINCDFSAIRMSLDETRICIWWMQRLLPKVEQPNKSLEKCKKRSKCFHFVIQTIRCEQTHWCCVTPFQMAGANDLAGFMLHPVNGP